MSMDSSVMQARAVQLKKRACELCASSLHHFELPRSKRKLLSCFKWWKFHDELGLPVTSYPPFLTLAGEYYTLKTLDEKKLPASHHIFPTLKGNFLFPSISGAFSMRTITALSCVSPF